MDNFKTASATKLRIQTNKGLLSVEQVWDLSLEELDTLAVSLEEDYKSSGKKSFLAKTTAKDRVAKLKFDVVLDILGTKVAENERLAEAQEIKEHNKKIIALIAEKDDDALKGKSRKQLEAMLR